MGGAPDISIVVPTRDRWDVLRETLEAILAQELDGVGAELLVVDNGSRDGSREALERFAAEVRSPLAVRVLDEPVPGAAAARNAGIREARAEVVLFLGDDCPPAVPGLVAGHAAAHGGGPARAVVGRIDWHPDSPHTEVMRWLIETGKML